MPMRRGLFEPAPAAAWPRALPWALMALAACGWAYTLLHAPGGQPRGPPPPPVLAAGLRLLPQGPVPQARAPTLVVYVFSGSDPEYGDNLRFFVGEAVKVRPPASAVCCSTAAQAARRQLWPPPHAKRPIIRTARRRTTAAITSLCCSRARG